MKVQSNKAFLCTPRMREIEGDAERKALIEKQSERDRDIEIKAFIEGQSEKERDR